MLLTGQFNKVFSPIFIYISKNADKHKICFYNVLFRHNSACVMIKKCLKVH